MSATSATVVIPDYLVGTWKADPVHSEIAFTVGDLLDCSVVATIDTGHAMRDDHLRTADYLESRSTPRWIIARPGSTGPTTVGSSTAS